MKMWYMCKMEFYLAITKNEIMKVLEKQWLELENVILSDISHVQMDKYFMISLIWFLDSKFHICLIFVGVYTEPRKLERGT